MNTRSNQYAFTDKLFWVKFIPAWVLGSLAAYFPTSFLLNFYTALYQFIFISLLFQSACIFVVWLFRNVEFNLRKDWATLLALLESFGLSLATITVLWNFPSLFNRRILFMDGSLLPLFAALALIAGGGMLFMLKTTRMKNIHESLQQNAVFKQIQFNLPGIVLAGFFFLIYFTLAETINFPNFRTIDQYFDLDISAWLSRLARPIPMNVISTRAVHPAVLVFLRPLIWLIALVLHGRRLQAVFLLNALVGALCVFVFWLILKRLTRDTAYSVIMAAMLGASASHLLLGSMLETYIYSALALILFVWVVGSENQTLMRTIPAGIFVIGITITNFIQTCILYLLARPGIKTILKYMFLVLISAILLNIVQVWIYPHAKSLLRPANLLVERHYQFDLTRDAWRVQGHIVLIIRAILLYGIVAPTPFILTKELGVIVPHFRTYEIAGGEFHVAAYAGMADVAVKLWVFIIAVAVVLFLRELFKSPRQMLFPISLLACLGFNLALHIAYGDDPMLYSADWVYALVLFVAFALRNWADQKWLHIILIVFLGFMMNANLNLIHLILKVSLPFYG